MKIPADAVIPLDKITRYLLVFRERDDKSKFLTKAGFTPKNPHRLLAALSELAATTEAVEDGDNEYGEFFRTEGRLNGPNGRALPVVLIWLRRYADGQFRFVTLKPLKEQTA
ncbi:MAG TPA: hypothetical protein VLT87_00940 [Thermoanaerobaculia bacterium]|nr:hypothetical protein [Thermoanaerobaculia bacterium]